MQMETPGKTARRLTVSVVIIILLSVSLALTTFALVYSMVSVEDNLFSLGTVSINLNGGKPIIAENEFLFEPGMVVKKDFFLENESTCDVFYKLYFQNVSGGLEDVLEIQICDGSRVLFEGTPSSLIRENVGAAEDFLKQGERRELQISFRFPPSAGNDTQGLCLSFDFAADAVQVKNNPNKEFE